jgi:hypothetical protein
VPKTARGFSPGSKYLEPHTEQKLSKCSLNFTLEKMIEIFFELHTEKITEIFLNFTMKKNELLFELHTEKIMELFFKLSLKKIMEIF